MLQVPHGSVVQRHEDVMGSMGPQGKAPIVVKGISVDESEMGDPCSALTYLLDYLLQLVLFSGSLWINGMDSEGWGRRDRPLM